MAHILIAEDDSTISDVLARFLTRLGHTVHITCDGLAALAHLDTSPVDLLITDLDLPQLSGLELIRRIRGAQHQARVVICSGFTRSPEVAAMADGVLAKPFLFQDLRAILDDVLPCVPVP